MNPRTKLMVRPARAADRESILKIYFAAAGPLTAASESALDRIIEAGGVLVALQAGDIIGFGGIDVRASEQLKWLYVRPEHQRAGAGAAILEQLQVIGWNAGLNSLRLHAAPAALDFYRRHGYEAVSANDRMGHDHDGTEMTKMLHANAD